MKIMANWIQAVATVLQALAAVGIVVLTVWTLKVLRQYARDTGRIADEGPSQVERSQMPFLALAQMPAEVGGWKVPNQGSGPALDITYKTRSEGRERMRYIAPLSKGDFYVLTSTSQPSLQDGTVLE